MDFWFGADGNDVLQSGDSASENGGRLGEDDGEDRGQGGGSSLQGSRRWVSRLNQMSTCRLLFVCLGNICRSPAAEAVMKKRVEEAGLSHRVTIDSAGTAGWHEGNPPDARMQKHGSKRGYRFDSVARQVRESDFEDFDLILVMDQQNLRDIRGFNPDGKLMHKVKLFTDFAKDRTETKVPDPYYGGDEGFEQVLDIVENGCRYLVEWVGNGGDTRLSDSRDQT